MDAIILPPTQHIHTCFQRRASRNTCFCRRPPYRLAVASVTSDAAATRLARALAAAAAALPVGIADAGVAAAPSALPVLTVSPAPEGEMLVAAPFVVGVVAAAVADAGGGVGDAESAPFLAAFGSRLRG